MKVSVISPLYNTAAYVQSTIDSLKAQTMTDFEVIFVDDHSTDGCLDIARQATAGDGRFRFLQTPSNSGPGVARNLGIQAAQGEYIAFIDSDDIYHPDFLRLLVEATAGDKDLAYCQLKYYGGFKSGRVHRNPIVPSGEFSVELKRYFLKHFVTFSVCFIYRKEFLQKNKLRFPELFNSEDTNFLIKAILLTHTIACVDEPLYYYVLHSGSLTTSRHTRRYKERLQSLNLLMKEYRKMRHQSEYSELQLNRYNLVMCYLWLKKGLLLSIIEFIKSI